MKLIQFAVALHLMFGVLGCFSGVSQTPVTPQSPAPLVQSEQIAQLFGLDATIGRVHDLQAGHLAGAPATLEEIALRQQLAEGVEAASLDVDSVIAELSNEQGDLGTLKTTLMNRRDKKVAHLTTAALLTGSGIGAAVNATQITNFNSTTMNTGDIVGIGSGVASTILSVLAAKAHEGPSGTVTETPNMLAPLLDRKPVLNTYYPPAVLKYLNSIPAGQDPARGTRMEQLMQAWDKAGRLSAGDNAKRAMQISVLTSSDDSSVKITIDELTDRIAMLGDVRGRVSLIKRDLSALMHTQIGQPVK